MFGKNKVDYFTIIFNKTNPIYSPGEPINGCVNIRLSERMKINGLRVVIDGKARVKWSSRRRRGKHSSQETYSSEESYMSITVGLILKNANGEEIYIESGEHSYPFNTLLPLGLPTSFENFYGQIRYAAYATLDIPWAFDKHTMRSFTMISPFDLNMMPNLRFPRGVTSSQIFGSWSCCMTDPVNVSFSVKQAGYVPGESILFNAIIDNQSTREINQISVKLIQDITLHGKETGFLPPLTKYLHTTMHQTTKERVISSTTYPGRVNAKEQIRWDNGMLIVPSLCPSSDKSCSIIEVNYFIRLGYMAGSDLYTTDELAIPITIGTIPFRFNDSNVFPPQQNVPSQLPSALPIGYPSLPQPTFTYQPTQAINNNRGDNMLSTPPPPYNDTSKGEMIQSDYDTFSPQYPYYKDFENIK